MEIQVGEILKMKKSLESIIGEHCGKTAEEIDAASDRDNFMSPEEALAFGIIDEIVVRANPAD